MKKFYSALKKQKYESAFKYVAEDASKKNWLTYLKKVQKVRGKIKTYKIKNWGFKTSTSKGS